MVTSRPLAFGFDRNAFGPVAAKLTDEQLAALPSRTVSLERTVVSVFGREVERIHAYQLGCRTPLRWRKRLSKWM